MLLRTSDDTTVAQTLARVEQATLDITFGILDIPEPSPVLLTAARGFLAYDRAACLDWCDGENEVTREQVAALLTGAFLGSLQAVATDPVVARVLSTLELPQ